MTDSEKKDIPDQAGAGQAQIPDQNLSDDSLEGVTGGTSATPEGKELLDDIKVDLDPSKFEKADLSNPGTPFVPKNP